MYEITITHKLVSDHCGCELMFELKSSEREGGEILSDDDKCFFTFRQQDHFHLRATDIPGKGIKKNSYNRLVFNNLVFLIYHLEKRPKYFVHTYPRTEFPAHGCVLIKPLVIFLIILSASILCTN